MFLSYTVDVTCLTMTESETLMTLRESEGHDTLHVNMSVKPRLSLMLQCCGATNHQQLHAV